MAYDEDLADRLRMMVAELDPGPVDEKKMFGGLAFLIGGHMSVSASGNGGVMLRCDPAASDEHVAAGAERVVMRGREMNGWLRVRGEQIATDEALRPWVAVGVGYAASLPPK